MFLNKVMLIGNLTRDPEIKALPSGIKVCSFGIATNRVWKDKNGAKQEAADFHNIVVFDRQAETVAQYMRKGSNVLVEGRLQTRSWDGTDGQKKYRTEIVADRVQFGSRPNSGGGAPYADKKSPEVPVDTNSGTDASPASAIAYPEEEINPDDIPF